MAKLELTTKEMSMLKPKLGGRDARATANKRLSPEEREEQIVQKAIQYFGAHGFSASTHELARKIGITQPLLYRYFPNKEALVERVFHEVYLSRWNPDCEGRR